MQTRSTQPTPRGIKFWWLALILLLATSPGFTENAMGASAAEIDVSVNVAMKRFYNQVEGAKEFARGAKGLLIMPNVKKAAFIVGGEYGEGALRIGGKTAEFVGEKLRRISIQIGAQAKDIIIAFMTQDALNGFRAGEGWEAGVDGNIALITIGAGERVDTRTIKDPIVGFVFDVKGLIADLSLKGAKFTKLNK